MNDDREMLELAAKAGDVELGDEITECGISLTMEDGRHRSLQKWNPLTDDGDALRLAVKLKLCVSIEFDRVDVTTPQMDNATEYFYDNPQTDYYAATRRAVVRAAAAIGKEMNYD